MTVRLVWNGVALMLNGDPPPASADIHSELRGLVRDIEHLRVLAEAESVKPYLLARIDRLQTRAERIEWQAECLTERDLES